MISPARDLRTRLVHFRSDGLRLAPQDYGSLLAALARDDPQLRDEYSTGGAVAALEKRFAAQLGKESGLFLPTGALANHLALSELADGTGRVLIQTESHVYQDAFDQAPLLPPLNLTALAPGRATVTAAEFSPALAEASAIGIECPVRRRHGAVFDFEEMKRVARLAREHQLGLHLDGARLPVASAYTGVAPAEYAALFDTVYVSLYKCFNAPSGAILTGPHELIERVRAARKRCGAELYQAWPNAAVALHYLAGFAERFARAMRIARDLFDRLGEHPRLRVEPVPEGTNVFKLHVSGVNPDEYVEALTRRGLAVRRQSADELFQGVWLVVNESLNASSAEEIAAVFFAALP